MKKTYNILLVDDESGMNFIEAELAKLDIQVQIDIINQKEQFIERLEHNPPDLVISDYNMPILTGTDALRIAKDRHPQLPFILVSGSISEEQAINFMLEGASDYVLKKNLDRLGAAILRELMNYESHKNQRRRHKKTRSQYENLVQSVNGIVWEADAETLEFLYVSPQSEQLLGYSPEEWISEPNFWQQHIHPDDQREAIQFCHDKTQHNEDHSFEYRMLDANNEVVWLRDYVSVITVNGKPKQLYGFMVDISGEKKAERQRDKAYEIANIGHWELDLMHDKLYWSNAVRKLHEVDSNFEPDLETALEFYKEGEHRQKITRIVENTMETGESFEVELKIITTKGKEKWVRVVGETDFRNGKSARIFGSTQDISKRKETERKLQESLERYESASKATSDTIWDWDLKTDTIGYSQNIYNTFGYEQQQVDVIEDWWRNKIHPDDRSNVIDTIEKALRSSSERFQMEYRFKAVGGIYRYIYDRAIIVKDQQGKPIRIIGAMRDVSDQKEAQHRMKEAFQERERILDRINEAFFAVDQNWNVTYWNKQAEEVLGVLRDDILGKNIWENFPEAKESLFFKEYKRALQEQVPVQFEEYYPPLEQWLEVNAYPSEEGLSVFFRDITERKEAEQSQRELYQKNRLVLESTADGIYGIDTDGRCTFINRAAANMLGYQSEECVGKNMHKLIHHQYSNGEIYPESECPIYISNNKHESCRVMDEVFWRADGTCFNVEYTSNPMIENGVIEGGVVAFSDITKRKQHEKELQESLEEKETLLMEIHHRVKNNLAIISSLITLQMLEVEDENFRNMLENTTSRIHSIAMVHELLYQSENFTEIPFEKYIKALLSTIKKTIGPDSNTIDLITKVKIGGLNINQAIPLGLMLNELMTNSLKYAFINREKGKIIVSIARSGNNIKVIYEDNGEGFPDHIDFTDTESLGNTLIHTLLNQLSGDFKVETMGKFRLEFQFMERKRGSHSNY